MSIRYRYARDLQDISDRLVQMCRHIEVAIEKCVKAFVDNDVKLAQEVYEEDNLIDHMERDIEQSCLKILIMEHPVASDFREVSAALKMITDLERIGDQARDIAEITIHMNKVSKGFSDGKSGNGNKPIINNIDLPVHIPQMAEIVTSMVKDGVQAYINRDLELARGLDATDDKVDALFNTVMADLMNMIKENPDRVEEAFMYLSINKYLERIGDHAVNIGEWVEYALTGVHPKSGN